MSALKRFFPFSFGVSDIVKLIINIIIYLIIAAVGGLILALLSKIAVIGFIFAFLGGLIDLYALIGIILAILSFCGLLK